MNTETKGAARYKSAAAPKFKRDMDAPEKQFDIIENNSNVNPDRALRR
jgi:hypothetical protein